MDPFYITASTEGYYVNKVSYCQRLAGLHSCGLDVFTREVAIKDGGWPSSSTPTFGGNFCFHVAFC